MDKWMFQGGRAAGLLGLAMILFAVGARLAGFYVVGGFQAVTILVGGMGALLVGCFGLLWTLAARTTAPR